MGYAKLQLRIRDGARESRASRPRERVHNTSPLRPLLEAGWGRPIHLAGLASRYDRIGLLRGSDVDGASNRLRFFALHDTNPRHATARIPASATRLALTITMIHLTTHLQHTCNIHNMTTNLLGRPSSCTCTPTAHTHSHARAHPRPLQPTTASRRDSASRREGPYKGKRPLNAQHKAQHNAQSAHMP